MTEAERLRTVIEGIYAYTCDHGLPLANKVHLIQREALAALRERRAEPSANTEGASYRQEGDGL